MRFLFALAALGTCFPAFSQTLATVGNTKITVEDFNRKLSELRAKSNTSPTPEQFLEDMVRIEVALQEAEKMKLANDPATQERIKQVLYSSLLEKELGAKLEAVKVSESEMKAFYKKNPELRLSLILIAAKPDAAKRAQEIFAEVKKSKTPFEDLARQYSEDPATKDGGGDIGFQSRLTVPTNLYELAVAMKDGEVRGPIETRYGFHIVKVTERRPYDLADKRQLRAAVLDQKRTEVFNAYFDKLKKNYKIDINREALKAVKN